jgi:acyl-coenzyme A synthetase/AMP-(fatty) acid ligase
LLFRTFAHTLYLCTGAAIAVALPLTVEAVVIYLAIILAGCVVVSIADSFAAHEVDTRLRISGAAAMFTQASLGLELG